MKRLSQRNRHGVGATRYVLGIAMLVPLVAFCTEEPMSLDELNQRISVTRIKPVVIDGKRLVAEKHRTEEVADQLCGQFGGRLKSLEIDFEHPVRADEVVTYHDGVHLQHYRLNGAEQFTAFESVVCVGLVVK